MHNLVGLVELIGLFAVGLCFIVLLPNTGAMLASIFGLVVGEQTLAKMQGRESGTNMHLDD
ncbi:MAG: hypothetical protein P8R54_27075 [Myxococcota bacterium]|jgi:hypothetical protein|nr:hypothetical protein [Myxococcota bacterium]